MTLQIIVLGIYNMSVTLATIGAFLGKGLAIAGGIEIDLTDEIARTAK